MNETSKSQAVILVPTDLSTASVRALPYARALAAQAGATIHLVHVHEIDRVMAALGTAPLLLADPAEITADLKRQLIDLAQQQGITTQPSQCHLQSGSPFDAVCSLASELHAELIVLASHGRGAVRRVLLGSTAERVVRHSPCPVLVIHEREHEFVNAELGDGTPAVSIKRIIAPTDFSECSLVGVRHALELARRFDAGVTILHAVNLLYVPPADIAVGYDLTALTEAARKAAEEQMITLLASLASPNLKIESRVRCGTPVDGVCNYANESEADLIVTATHGHTGLSHVLIGSTAEKLVRYANCPVLVVPTTRAQDKVRKGDDSL